MIAAVAAWLALQGCDRPELEPYERSVAAWDEGVAALDAGNADAAVAAFARARGDDPASVELLLWHARALAAAGRLGEADDRLSEALARDPKDGLAWYNRAAYRARAGRPEDAAADLHEALRHGEVTPFDAASDPDFAAVRTHPALSALLPASPLLAEARGPDGSVFVGSRFDVVLQVLSPVDGPPIRVARGGTDPGCLRLVRVIEDVQARDRMRSVSLVVTFEAVGPCDARLGPLTVASSGGSVDVDAVAVHVEAPPGAPPAAGTLPDVFPLPSALAPVSVGHVPGTAEGSVAWSAAQVGGGVAVLGPQAPQRADGVRPDVVLELRSAGQTTAAGGWWAGVPRVDVRVGGGTLGVP